MSLAAAQEESGFRAFTATAENPPGTGGTLSLAVVLR
jgi:hypothetical protein